MPILPNFNPARFRRGEPIDNPYFPLVPGTVQTYQGTTADGETTEGNDYFATSLTKDVLGIQTLVVRDTAYEDGLLVEETIDFFAQDRDGNVWYFGEEVINYRYDDDGNFIGTDNDGAWLAGVNGAQPGWIMPADPRPGLSYFNEFAPGIAVDEALVVARNVRIETELGRFRTLQTLDTTALDPDAREFKYYAQGIGLVRADEGLDENNEPELVVELRDTVRAGTSRPPEGAEVVATDDFISDGSGRWVTVVAEDSELANALGYYTFDRATGEIGEGRILFADSDAVDPGDTVRIQLPDGHGIGLFFVPGADELGLDVADFRSGGLFFSNILTGAPARLSDGMAPIVTDEDGNPLPIPVFHALGAAGGSNLLNPGLGLQAVEWQGADEVGDGIVLIGFEDLRRTQEDYDGDFDDVLVAFSDERLDAEEVEELAGLLSGGAEAVVGKSVPAVLQPPAGAAGVAFATTAPFAGAAGLEAAAMLPFTVHRLDELWAVDLL